MKWFRKKQRCQLCNTKIRRGEPAIAQVDTLEGVSMLKICKTCETLLEVITEKIGENEQNDDANPI